MKKIDLLFELIFICLFVQMKSKSICIVLLILCYGFWILTQSYLENDIYYDNKIYDRVHENDFMLTINTFLNNHELVSTICIVLTTLMLDVTIACCCVYQLLNVNIQPFIIIFAGVVLRQLCQFMNKLPAPEGVIWYDPFVPSLIINYAVKNDFFFSGHTFAAITFGNMMLESRNKYIVVYAYVFMFSEIFFVLVSRAHYFMDVYAAISTYYMLEYFCHRVIRRISLKPSDEIFIQNYL